jgi:putative transposase
MARLARLTFVGYPHHVVQRGNYDQPVFETEADYRQYLAWLQEYTIRYGVDIWAYCLMPSHVHFICVPKAEDSLARAFNTIHMRYAQYFNAKRLVHGHLWNARFMSCALDDASVREEVRFVEMNPVRLNLVKRAEDYPWSSARGHAHGEMDPILSDGCFLTDEITDWNAYLVSRGDDRLLGRARARLKTGRPAGEPTFIHMLEEITGRRLVALPRGRPRKRMFRNTTFL